MSWSLVQLIFILCIKIMHVWILRDHFFLSLCRFQGCTVLALCVHYFLTLHEYCDGPRPVSKLSMCCWSWEATRGPFCCPSGLVSAWWHKGRVATVCCAPSARVFHCSRTFPAIVKMVQQFPLIRGFIFCRFSYPVRKYYSTRSPCRFERKYFKQEIIDWRYINSCNQLIQAVKRGKIDFIQ